MNLSTNCQSTIYYGPPALTKIVLCDCTFEKDLRHRVTIAVVIIIISVLLEYTSENLKHPDVHW